MPKYDVHTEKANQVVSTLVGGIAAEVPFELNRYIANRVRSALFREGYRLRITREGDKFIYAAYTDAQTAQKLLGEAEEKTLVRVSNKNVLVLYGDEYLLVALPLLVANAVNVIVVRGKPLSATYEGFTYAVHAGGSEVAITLDPYFAGKYNLPPPALPDAVHSALGYIKAFYPSNNETKEPDGTSNTDQPDAGNAPSA